MPRPLQTSILSLCALGAALLAQPTSADAAIYYYVGDNGTSTSTADTSGTWDNTSTQWTTTSGTAAGTAYSSSPTNDAVFEKAGGTHTVVLDDDIVVGALSFTAGTYSIDGLTSVRKLTVGSISNTSGIVQSITLGGQSSIGAATGTAVNFDNFADTTMTGAVTSTAINNFGTLALNGSFNAPNAALDNQGTTTLNTSATVNSLTSNLSAALFTSTNHLTVTNDLSLGDSDTFSFTLQDSRLATDEFITSASLTDGSAGTTNISFSTLGPITPNHVFELFAFSSTAGGLDLGDFTLLTPSGYEGSFLTFDGDSLNLTVVPEISSSVLPLVGAALLSCYRRRRALTAAVVA